MWAHQFRSKECRVCGKEFQPTSGNQWRCAECSSLKKRPGKTPRCQCGCGELVKWGREHNSWRAFVRGHATRVNGNLHGFQKGHVPANTGNLTLHAHTCPVCGKKWENRKKHQIHCSNECSASTRSGSNSPLWKGGRPPKYKYVAQGGRSVREHRVVMEQLQGRPLFPGEIVHHIDEDGQNNEPSNLHLFHCHGCHNYHHMTGKPLKYNYAVVHQDD